MKAGGGEENKPRQIGELIGDYDKIASEPVLVTDEHWKLRLVPHQYIQNSWIQFKNGLWIMEIIHYI